ncbi:MAG: GNAT family N-acetyltransferase [Tannerellaceae bacterium]|nr:GNAT family N-acetyltransferase [Tannerellaceae bacterium]
MKPIQTDRLMVRLAELEDAEAIYSYRSDVLANKYQGWFPGSIEEVRDYMVHMPRILDVVDICFQFAIVELTGNRLIGDMGISFTGHEGMQAEIGYTLHPDFQGKGYATEAVNAMMEYLFIVLKKHRIIASVDPRNTASIRLLERLSFRKEAHFRESYFLRGEWTDDVVYAMLEKEF